jgi:hypothetical protein
MMKYNANTYYGDNEEVRTMRLRRIKTTWFEVITQTAQIKKMQQWELKKNENNDANKKNGYPSMKLYNVRIRSWYRPLVVCCWCKRGWELKRKRQRQCVYYDSTNGTMLQHVVHDDRKVRSNNKTLEITQHQQWSRFSEKQNSLNKLRPHIIKNNFRSNFWIEVSTEKNEHLIKAKEPSRYSGGFTEIIPKSNSYYSKWN